ncbi:MAG TPA: amino acid permease [Peptococcaceae bacterium]|nr:MAG: Uncharacterized protein XD50_1229 [Clostridia bacterium 41_269]HBT20766.1 amino acid permease [Peptococcaceae bacterium]
MNRWKALLKRLIIGKPLPYYVEVQERLTNAKALAIFSSDALSSVAYGPEEILWVLVAVGAVGFSLPIHVAIVILLAILTASYRQVIAAYPNGGGAYVVAKENLGMIPALIAGSALLTDYILTVAVSVSAGIAAISSLYPVLFPFRVELALLAVLFITIINLRGVRETGTVFSIPTFVFIVSTMLMIGVGITRVFFGDFANVETAVSEMEISTDEAVSLFILMRAFVAGCTSLTGVEAISNGVKAFKPPEAQNARKTMLAMALLLSAMLLGMGILSSKLHIVPSHEETVMSQIASQVYGRENPLYAVHQLFTMLILILAANTSFADFPRVCSLLSRDKFLPRSMAARGDRLVFSNGIIMLAVLASLLIVIFRGTTHALLPLYAVGVFTSFTLSQMGMVIHWLNLRDRENVWKKIAVNGLGAIVTGVVTVVIIVTKFVQGAWIVILVIPAGILLMLLIHRHYEHIRNDLKVGYHTPITPQSKEHQVVLLLGGTTSVARTAVQYILTLVGPQVHLRAVHVDVHQEGETKVEELKREFSIWVENKISLDILDSPYRSVIEPLDRYMDDLRRRHPQDIITLVIPEFIPRNPIAARLLHGQTGKILYDHFRQKDFNVIVVPHKV